MHPCKTTGQLHFDLPSSNMRPHSWSRIHSMTRSASHERFVLCEIIEYVLMQIEQPAVRVQNTYTWRLTDKVLVDEISTIVTKHS